MSDKAASQKTRSPEGCGENGPAAALLLSHVSIQICSFVAPCRRPILIATPLHQSLTWCTRAEEYVGVTSKGRTTPEAPARAEPRPTCAVPSAQSLSNTISCERNFNIYCSSVSFPKRKHPQKGV